MLYTLAVESMSASDHIKVLHLISGLEAGGAERMLLWSARYHDRRIFRLLIVSLMSGGVFADAIRREGVEVMEMGQKRGRLSIPGFFDLLKITRNYAPDFIQGHLFHSNILARIMAPLVPGAMAISTRHNERDSWIRRLLYALTSPLNEATIVFSPSVEKHARGDNLACRPIRQAPYGIDPVHPFVKRSDLRESMAIPQDVYLWITVGRLTRQKGVALLIEAFRSLQNRNGSRPMLLIVGEGEERYDLERRAVEGGLVDHVRFLGNRSDVPELLAASDAFVLSSLWEGGPLVVLEAMAAGLPVVATRVGDVPAMVEDGRSGFIVEPGDIGALAKAISKVMDLGPEGRVLGETGRKKVTESFLYEGTQRSVENIYRDLAGIQRGGC
jgi:glycosyltransferase involved in cell wall biosynthesis